MAQRQNTYKKYSKIPFSGRDSRLQCLDYQMKNKLFLQKNILKEKAKL